MKSILLIFLVILNISQLVSQTTEKLKLDSILLFELSRYTGEFFSSGKHVYSYDEMGRSIESIYYTNNDTIKEFKPLSKSGNNINKHGEIVGNYNYFWDSKNNDWRLIRNSKINEIIDSNITEYIYYKSLDTTNDEFLYSKEVFYFDSNKNDTLYILYGWDNIKKLWFVNYKALRTFDSLNRILFVDEFTWINSEKYYKFMLRKSFEYDYNNYCYKYSRLTGNISTNNLNVISTKYYYYDDKGNISKDSLFEITSQSDSNLVYATYFSYDYEKNNINYFKSWLTNYYDGYRDIKYDYTYKVNEEHLFDYSSSNKLKYIIKKYFYSPFIINSIDDKTENTLVYPNPANNVLHFRLEGDTFNTFVEIFDIHGRMIKKDNLNENKSINIESLDKGIYFYVISDSKDNIKGKFIKE